jgi:peptidoglycan/xylan/chitin deacetylase (PgdA/CDA1 family)
VISLVHRGARVLRRRAVRALRRRHIAHGLILTYHSVSARGDPDPWALRVSPAHFREHLDVLKNVADVVSLPELLAHFRRGRRQRPIVALTFDDGYADNLHEALPVLQHFALPATVFVATSWLGRPEPFWWDALANTILGTDALPNQLHLPLGSTVLVWKAAARSATGSSPAERADLLSELRNRLKPLPDDTRRDACRTIEAWAGHPGACDSLCRPMTANELQTAHGSGLIEIGAHTMTHCSLPSLPLSAQRIEIQGSLMACEQLLGIRPTSFAYPYGEYSAATAQLVTEAGVQRCCTNEQDLAWENADAMRLPRFVALDWDGEQFERRLKSEWLP